MLEILAEYGLFLFILELLWWLGVFILFYVLKKKNKKINE